MKDRSQDLPVKARRAREETPRSVSKPLRRRVPQTLTIASALAADAANKNPSANLPPPPAEKPARRYGALVSFVLCVVMPVTIAAFYYFSVASNQYVAEFRFMVKDSTSGATASDPGLLSALGASSLTINTENYLVADYLTSRQAVEDLQSRIKIVDLYSKPTIDFWSRYDSSQPMERFVTYWRNMASAKYDQITGIATAEVRAFTPEDTLLVAQTMVSLAEDLVNRISSRAREDAVRFAEKEVEKAQERVRRVRLQVMDGRGAPAEANANLLFDLERQVAQNLLASAMQSLDQARARAASQHLYITPYVRPSLPRSSTYPNRFYSLAKLAFLTFLFWLIGLLVVRSVAERFH